MQLSLELVLGHCELDVGSLQKGFPHIKAVVVVRNHHFDIGFTCKLTCIVLNRHADLFNAHLKYWVENPIGVIDDEHVDA